MNETFVTFHGWAGSEVRLRTARDVKVATVRVAVTPRLRKDGEWSDGETTWYSVTAWRTLAEHLRASVRKGDPVIVHGRLRTETWAPESGPASTTLHVEASLIGHDLTRGISHFIKAQRPDRGVQDREDEAAEGGSPVEEHDDLAGEPTVVADDVAA